MSELIDKALADCGDTDVVVMGRNVLEETGRVFKELFGDAKVIIKTAIETHNLAQLGVNNGDCGVIVETRPVPTIALPGPGGVPRRLPCSLIPSLQPLQAMTIHKAQGSQFTDVTVVLPPPDSPLLSRELLYTAITRAREHLTVVGTRESVERAIDRANDRRSGIQRRWEESRTS